MSAKSHFKLHQPVKIDGVDFETGVYPVEEIDSGRQSSIVNAGWGCYCDAPKSKPKATTDDDPDLDVDEVKTDVPPAKPKPRSRAKSK